MERITSVIETPTAIIECLGPDLIIVRHRADRTLSADAVRENINARKLLSGTSPKTVIAVFPQDLGFDMSVLSTDHFSAPELAATVMRLAIVAEAGILEHIARMYLAYFPPGFRVQVFKHIDDAMAWVATPMAEAS